MTWDAAVKFCSFVLVLGTALKIFAGLLTLPESIEEYKTKTEGKSWRVKFQSGVKIIF